MKTVFKGKKISGIVSILPEKTAYFDDEINNYDFPEKQTKRLKKVMGYNKHCLSKEKSTTADFCVYGLDYLIKRGLIDKNDIGAIVVVTLSPDYFLPHVSNIVHGKCDLPEEVICMDISQGCCGFLVGLIQACMLLDHLDDKKVVLFNADVLSHKVSHKDRNEFPLIGDVSCITIIENDVSASDIYMGLYYDGKDRDALIIQAGGFAMPASESTKVPQADKDGNIRSLENLRMDGMAILDFVLSHVPDICAEILEYAHSTAEEIDYFLFHQPNRFILEKLLYEVNVPEEKLFMNIVENYGNPSGASIPLNIVHNMSSEVLTDKFKVCLAAFGSGLSWGAAVMELGKLDFCEEIKTNL